MAPNDLRRRVLLGRVSATREEAEAARQKLGPTFSSRAGDPRAGRNACAGPSPLNPQSTQSPVLISTGPDLYSFFSDWLTVLILRFSSICARTFSCALEALHLVLQLQEAFEAVGREGAVFDRLLHRAARLVAMPAVGEVTAGGQLHDVLEGLARAFVLRPELQLAHARRVDQQAAALRQQDHWR